MSDAPSGSKGTHPVPSRPSLLDAVIRFCLENKLVVVLIAILIAVWGAMVAPFDWNLGDIPRSPVPTDAIPDVGENQQIVFTEWMGRSPQDVDDQITYPLTVALLGIPEVKTVRSYSYFGFSSIYVIFNEKADFYWSRSRVLEKLASLPAQSLPEGVRPTLGPDATALGQVFWYTLEGRDARGQPAGGWDLDELRSIQDWTVRYALASVHGVAEVASVGGFVREYQIDVDPDALRAHGVRLEQVFEAVRMSNLDVGARTIEVNRVEYVIRGLGFIRSIADLEKTVVGVGQDNTPIRVKDVAHVSSGSASRRGALDKEGAEAVGGVVVVRYGQNPLQAIKDVKRKIDEIAPGLPERVLPDGRTSKVTIVPFYDRTGLIYETLGTLNDALLEEILVTIIVVIVSVMHLRSSILISGLLPLAVLMCFIAMKLFRVDANIVALSGIAIAIGTMVDMGIVICENILKHLDAADPGENRLEVVYRAASEVGSAVLTAVATTVIGFLPVFTMQQAEGKLFRPLAFTKTFALIASLVVALTIIAPAAHVLFVRARRRRRILVLDRIPRRIGRLGPMTANLLVAAAVVFFLTRHWLPLGPEKGMGRNLIFVGAIIGSLLLFFQLFQRAYPTILRFCLRRKLLFLSVPAAIVLLGATVWLGFDRVFSFIPGATGDAIRETSFWVGAREAFPGLGKEFMPPLDEGSFLYMPTTMPHASIGECLDVLQKQDLAIRAIPEVDSVVGKIGRVDSPLDPAPISMVETIIRYIPEYATDKDGRRIRYRFDEGKGEFARDAEGERIPDPDGRPFRQWRDSIRTPDDIWDEIVRAAQLPGSTAAPKLQPIAARIVMLQSGMRAPMGVKVNGPTLEAIESTGLEIERLLKEVPSVRATTVFADRVVGKPYVEIHIDRDAIARYGLTIKQVQDVIEVAIGGRRLTTTVEGRERYPVRVRYLRELRDEIDTLGRILVSSPGGVQVPLDEVAEITYVRGPQVIKSEDT
ncbi:MAG: efflux RND transporter permease subunit, partial [Planctomycetes bacterium]|nr:efflux RND transporter permease subunit [Planctomycetota bacterium]